MECAGGDRLGTEFEPVWRYPLRGTLTSHVRLRGDDAKGGPAQGRVLPTSAPRAGIDPGWSTVRDDPTDRPAAALQNAALWAMLAGLRSDAERSARQMDCRLIPE